MGLATANTINYSILQHSIEFQNPLPITLNDFDAAMNDLHLFDTHNDALKKNERVVFYCEHPRNLLAMLVVVSLYRCCRGQVGEDETFLLDDSNLLDSFVERNNLRNYNRRWWRIARTFELNFYDLHRHIFHYRKGDLSFFSDADMFHRQRRIFEVCMIFKRRIQRVNINRELRSIYHISILLDYMYLLPPVKMLISLILIAHLMLCFFDESSSADIVHN